MAYIYQADLYCDDCGRLIRRDIRNRFKESNDPTGLQDAIENGDSDDWPRICEQEEEADYPVFCGSAEQCVNGVELADRTIGMPFGNALTGEGEEYIVDLYRSADSELRAVYRQYWEWMRGRFDSVDAIERLTHDD